MPVVITGLILLAALFFGRELTAFFQSPLVQHSSPFVILGLPIFFGLIQNGAVVATRSDNELRDEIVEIITNPQLTINGLRPVWRETLKLYYLEALTEEQIAANFELERVQNIAAYRCDGVKAVARALGESKSRVYQILETELDKKIIGPVLTKDRLADLPKYLGQIIVELEAVIAGGWVIGGLKFTKDNTAILKAYFVDKQNMPAIMQAMDKTKDSVFSMRNVAARNLIKLLVQYGANVGEVKAILKDMAPVRIYSSLGQRKRGWHISGADRVLRRLKERADEIAVEMQPQVSETYTGLDFIAQSPGEWEEEIRRDAENAVAEFKQAREAERLAQKEASKAARISRQQERTEQKARLERRRQEAKVAKHQQMMRKKYVADVVRRQIGLGLEAEAISAQTSQPEESSLSEINYSRLRNN
jgi:hypothetical protein